MDGSDYVKDPGKTPPSSGSETDPKSLLGKRVKVTTTSIKGEKTGEKTKFSVCRKVEEYDDILVTPKEKSSKGIGFWALIMSVIASLIATAIWELGKAGLF